MVIVDVPANPVYMGSVLPQDTNFTAIWQAKERRIIRCDKANPFFLPDANDGPETLSCSSSSKPCTFLSVDSAAEDKNNLCIRTEHEILTRKVNRTVDLTVTVR